jgi:ankyrin repeat protein
MKMRRLCFTLLLVAMIVLLAGCRTALVNAILSDRVETARMLIADGADVNEAGPDNFTPLHWAAYYGKTEMAKLLLSKGAQVNPRSPGYGTPLTIAAQYGFNDTARVLLDKGADASIADASGQTALQYATEHNNVALIALLKGSSPSMATGVTAPVILRGAPPVGSPTEAASLRPVALPGTRTSAGQTAAISVAVFHFTSLNIEASGYGVTVANAFIESFKKEPRLIILERRELENFLIANELQQNDQVDNVVNIGSRLGLNYVIAGTVEKKGSLFVTHCKVISMGKRSIAFSKRSTSAGEGNLLRDVDKVIAETLDFVVRSTPSTP